MRELNVNDVVRDVPYILDAFSKRVKEDPGKLLLVNPATNKKVTRQGADEVSARLYRYLRNRGITTESRVMICLPRGDMPLIAILGVLKAGAAFTLVEDDYVQERIEYIRKDFGTDVFLDIHTWHEAMREEPLWGYQKPNDNDLCLAVYTSGTTGDPKGVLNEYGKIKLLYLSLLSPRAALGNVGRVTALVSPLNFVAAIKRVFDLFTWGDTMHVLPNATYKNPTALREYVVQNDVELMFMTPSLFRTSFVGVGGAMKLVILGGEPANGICDNSIYVFNEYGMSETVYSLFMTQIKQAYDVCPCGPVAFDWAVYILDENGEEVPEGQTGEICFRNPFFRGYANLPKKTAEALRGGVFHSGDLGMVCDGMFYVKGRTDDMIKINGNRVEPAEIEAVAKRIATFEWCGVRGFEDPDRSFLCFYHTGELSMEPDELRKQMEKYLPYYMIPTYFVQIDKAPLNANGKLSRRLLPRPDTASFESTYEAPQTEFEQLVCNTFATVLGKPKIGVNDDFYYLGGDSLLTMRLVAELPKDYISATEVFRERTPKNIAKVLERKHIEPSTNPEEKELRARQKSYILTPTQLKMFDYQLYAPKSCMWNLPHMFSFQRDAIDVERFVRAVNQTIDHHPIFRTVFGFDENGAIVQRLDEQIDAHAEVEHVSDEEFEALQKTANEPFKLIGSPLIRVRLFLTPTQFHFLVLCHHVVIDGMGINAVLNTVEALYQGNDDLPLDTYYSWLEDQRAIQASEDYAESRQYFNTTYGTGEWCNNLISNNVTSNNARVRHDFLVRIPDDAIQKLEKEHQLSKNGLCAALTLLALRKTEGRDRIMLSWVYANRNTTASESAAGLMLKFLPLGAIIGDDTQMDEVFSAVAKRSTEAIVHSSYDWLPGKEEVFETDPLLMVYESSILNFAAMRRIWDGVRLTFLPDPSNSSIGRVSLQIMEEPHGMRFCLFYAQEFFTKEHIDMFHSALAHYVRKLGGSMVAA